VRVAILLAVLLGVCIYALLDYSARRARRSWQRPLEVALVLLTLVEHERFERDGVPETSEPVPASPDAEGPDAESPDAPSALDAAVLEAFAARVPALEVALAEQFVRYGGEFSPIHFQLFGPVPEVRPAPVPAADPGLLEPLRVSYGLWRFARASDAAAGLSGGFDGKIYVVLSPPRSERRALVEGLGQDGGRIAVTHIELSEDSVDFGLFVVAHELFHLLGASDRYAADGTTLIPEGLGDPEQDPLYPQRSVEVMARGRVLRPDAEEPPGHLQDLRVGAKTAAEIGWGAVAGR
jgi:hypothetical protein